MQLPKMMLLLWETESIGARGVGGKGDENSFGVKSSPWSKQFCTKSTLVTFLPSSPSPPHLAHGRYSIKFFKKNKYF